MANAIQVANSVSDVKAYLDFPKLQKQFLNDLDIKKSSVSTCRRLLDF
ncbi:MAG: hypothetical protein NTW44_01045 [Nitrospirae bacterium]|nr:hypothetical protein [Nitrospirota bacterium]